MSYFDGTQSTSVAELKRPLVLVVDDDEGIRDALREILEDAGFATVDARDGLEALKLLGKLTSAPTFILLDLTMPVMDGWAFCESRGRSRTLSEIPVIAISADDLSEGERPEGIDAFLSKPIDVDKFARLAIRMAALCSLRARRNKRPH
jgi:CheY-like chemotaxis protein